MCTAPAGSTGERAPHAYKKALVQAATAAPGTTLEVSSRAIEAIWNPRPSDLRIDPGLPLSDHSWHSSDQLTVTVFDNQPAVTDPGNKRAANGFSFEVPDVDPGRYLLLIYDGSEAGNHATWDFVRVPSNPTDGESSDGASDFPLVPVLIPALVVLAVVVIWQARRRRAP